MYGQFYDGSPWIKSGCAQKWMQLQRWGQAVMRPFAKLLRTLLTIIKPKRTAYSRDGFITLQCTQSEIMKHEKYVGTALESPASQIRGGVT